ncbi:hypothetical protein JXO52_04265 [bacterium]|nr:hypothetical protein [bacterium]
MKRTYMVIIFIVVLLPTFVWSQIKKEHITVYAGLSLPSGDFGDDRMEEDALLSGFARTGFGALAEYDKQLDSPGLAWVSGIAVMFNGFDTDALPDGDSDEINAGSWIILPAMTGLRYATEVSSGTLLYGIGQIAFSLISAPDIDIENTEIKMGSATTLGFVLGGGVMLNNRINIGLRYFLLGEPSIKGEARHSGDSDDVTWEPSVSTIFLTVGLRLGGK